MMGGRQHAKHRRINTQPHEAEDRGVHSGSLEEWESKVLAKKDRTVVKSDILELKDGFDGAAVKSSQDIATVLLPNCVSSKRKGLTLAGSKSNRLELTLALLCAVQAVALPAIGNEAAVGSFRIAFDERGISGLANPHDPFGAQLISSGQRLGNSRLCRKFRAQTIRLASTGLRFVLGFLVPDEHRSGPKQLWLLVSRQRK